MAHCKASPGSIWERRLGRQIALSLILLVGAGLFVGTLRNLMTIDPGFSRRSILLVNAQFKQPSIGKDQRTQNYNQMLERIRAIPGVISAARSMRTPITNFGMNGLTFPEGYQASREWIRLSG